MIIRNTNPFEYYIIQQLFNDVNVPRCHTENLSYENIFIPFKYTLLLFSQSYFFRHKYKGHDFFRSGALVPVARFISFLSNKAWLKTIVTSQMTSTIYRTIWHLIYYYFSCIFRIHKGFQPVGLCLFRSLVLKFGVSYRTRNNQELF